MTDLKFLQCDSPGVPDFSWLLTFLLAGGELPWPFAQCLIGDASAWNNF